MHKRPDDPRDDGPSKSQRKRDSHALQRLGERLVALSEDQLRRVPMPEKLAEAVALARRVTAREGRRRQLQYIGRLMRDLDPAPLQHALDRMTDGDRAATALLHAAETWRGRLLDDPAARASWLERYPRTATSRLDALVDGARAEVAARQNGRQFRELYRLLRDTLADPPADTPPANAPTADAPTANATARPPDDRP